MRRKLFSKKAKTPSKYQYVYKNLFFKTWFLRNKDIFNISKSNKEALYETLESKDEARIKHLYTTVSNFLMHNIVNDLIENNNIFIMPYTNKKGKLFIGTSGLYRKIGKRKYIRPNFLTDGKAYTTHLQLPNVYPKHYKFRLNQTYKLKLKEQIESGKIYLDQEKI